MESVQRAYGAATASLRRRYSTVMAPAQPWSSRAAVGLSEASHQPALATRAAAASGTPGVLRRAARRAP
jgi:hypothetical protein